MFIDCPILHTPVLRVIFDLASLGTNPQAVKAALEIGMVQGLAFALLEAGSFSTSAMAAENPVLPPR
jgi:hypothetical protein